MKHQTIFLFLLLFLCQTLPAQQTPQPHFRNYSTEQGLPSPETYCAFQDSRGYMWFGTDNGASRFDGYTFRTYDARDGLTSNVVLDILEDDKGRIWFGTITGEAFILEGDTIVPYRFNHLVQRYRDRFSDGTLTYYSKRNKMAYFELSNLGVLSIDSLGQDSLMTTERPFSRLILNVDEIPKVMRTEVSRTKESEWSKWAIFEENHQVFNFEVLSEKGRMQKELSYTNLPCRFTFGAQKLRDGHLLVVHCRKLFCLREEEVCWQVPFYHRSAEIIENDDQTIWFCGIYGQGLRRYRNLEALKKGQYDHFLAGLSISNFYKDPKGGLWVTTLEQGVFYCPNIQLLTFDSRFGFSDDFVSAVTFINERELFAGCDNGDIYRVNLDRNRIEKTLVNPAGYHNHDLLYRPETNVLWSNGAYWKEGKWSFVSMRNYITKEVYPFNTTKLEKLHINASGDLVGCNHAGFYIIDIRNDTLRFDPRASNLRERTFAVYTDSRQRLWVGNTRGLFEFRDSMLISPGIEHPAFHIRVEDIDEFPDSSLAFGTKGQGVVRWKGEDVLQLTTDEGLTSNMIEDVHVDEKSILWVGTLNGLNKITFDAAGKTKVRPFTVANGLPSNEIYRIKSYAGQVWLCTAGGLVKFHEPAEDTVAATPVIQYLKIDSEDAALVDGQTFKHHQNSLEFRFLAINYRQNGRIPYRYRLNERADWQYTQNFTVNFPQLPPNKYRFEVQAQNQDGYWSSSTAYAFTIRPPWWRTWWAQGAAAGLLLGGLFYYRRREMTRLQKEAAVKQQIAALERSALQAQMNPHFIFNCLNSIQNFILTNEKKRAVEFLARFARLVRHNLNASVQGRVSLEEEVRILDDYLALERERFEGHIDYNITVDESLDKEEVFFPPLLIQPYVENAVIHGLAKKAGGGRVDIRFGRENGRLAVSVRDNGVGYRVDSEEKTSARHKSVGMSITQQRLELLNKAAARPEIEMLRDAEGVVLGTEVRLWLQIGGEEA